LGTLGWGGVGGGGGGEAPLEGGLLFLPLLGV